MAVVDFADADALDRWQRDPLNVAINDAVGRATAAAARLSRMYLGASIIGHECSRHIQYDWMCTPELSARVRLIFDRGHAFEPLVRAQLILAGFQFARKEALEFTALDGFLQGHADGIVVAGPDLSSVDFAYPAIRGKRRPSTTRIFAPSSATDSQRRFRGMRRKSPSTSVSSRSPIPRSSLA